MRFSNRCNLPSTRPMAFKFEMLTVLNLAVEIPKQEPRSHRW